MVDGRWWWWSVVGLRAAEGLRVLMSSVNNYTKARDVSPS